MNALKTLSRVTSLKDEYLNRHHEGVCIYACKISNLIELQDEMCEAVRLSALFHDLGKIGIPDRILFKPGKLTKIEWEYIQMHPESGADLLSRGYKQNYNINNDIIRAVLYHHENYDGTGYPEGLRGTDIPLAARIISIADAFDAMTTERNYKKTLTKKEALQEITHCSGSKFDPVLANIFVNYITQESGLEDLKSSQITAK